MRTVLGVFVGLLGFVSATQAHYNMLLPSSPSLKKGEPVTLTYQWGHPFEHQLFDAPAPERLVVLDPDGKKVDLTKKLTKVLLPGPKGKKVTAYQLRFTPDKRGDYVFVLRTPPIWVAEEEVFFQDTVKVVLHVQAQKGWDSASSIDFEFTPLTRPYGLRPGMVFQAEIKTLDRFAGKLHPVSGSLVEVERYNSTPPKELPADEDITRTVKTDGKGVVTTTLTDPGWWCLTTSRDGGTVRKRGDKNYPVKERCTFWVFVAGKVSK
jgi:uncharacterized GH25 family protein